MTNHGTVWVFHGDGGRFAGGVFATEAVAIEWIGSNRLSGVLTEYPLDVGVFEWALSEGLVNLRADKLALKRDDPRFIGCFTSASQRHIHFESGERS